MDKSIFVIAFIAIALGTTAIITEQDVNAKSLRNHDGNEIGYGCSSSSTGAENANTFCNGQWTNGPGNSNNGDN